MRRRLFAGILLPGLAALGGPLYAAEGPAGVAAPAVGGASGAAAQLAQLVLGLGLVIGLIFLLAWLVRRVQQVGPRSNRLIRTLASQPLGPRDRLVLVQVGEEQILLGITPGRITPLHVLKEPVHLPDGEPATPEFAQRLLELLNKDPKGKP